MDLVVGLERCANTILNSLDSQRDLLAAVKGLRNGLVWVFFGGFKILGL